MRSRNGIRPSPTYGQQDSHQRIRSEGVRNSGEGYCGSRLLPSVGTRPLQRQIDESDAHSGSPARAGYVRAVGAPPARHISWGRPLPRHIGSCRPVTRQVVAARAFEAALQDFRLRRAMKVLKKWTTKIDPNKRLERVLGSNRWAAAP